MSDNDFLQEEATVLKQMREALNMKQTDFAYFLKVTPATISSCETGKREMVLTFEQWRKLARHRAAQEAGRHRLFADYRLRIAHVIRDYGMNARDQAPEDSRAANG